MPMAGCHKSRGKYIVTGDERMGFIVLGILCAAAVVVTLACLWINR